ncbi:MAG: QueT transporter family protein [Christensenellaceae bacterium]|nr:QueT transporter family protein [Christensenellaceae bacterium]
MDTKSFFIPRMLTPAAVIAAIYAAVALLLAPISGFQGNFQLRVSEALTILPVLTPAAVPGLFVGCLTANLLGGATALDVIFGSLATLIAALLTRRLRARPVLAALPPVAVNMLVVGLVLSLSYNTPFLLNAMWVGLGQLGACYALGLPLLWALRKVDFPKI